MSLISYILLCKDIYAFRIDNGGLTDATEANPDDWELIEVADTEISFTETSDIEAPLSGDFKVVCCKYYKKCCHIVKVAVICM